MTVDPGLCADCRHTRRIESARGSVFQRCLLHDVDARYPKYPRLPVLRCEGYEKTAGPPLSQDGEG